MATTMQPASWLGRPSATLSAWSALLHLFLIIPAAGSLPGCGGDDDDSIKKVDEGEQKTGNRLPLLLVPESVKAVVGEELQLRAKAVDPDGDALTLELLGAPAAASVVQEEGGLLLTWTPAAEDEGTVALTFRASDGQKGHAPVEAVCQVVVQAPPANQPPTLLVAPEVKGQVGEPLTVVALAADPEGDPLELSVTGAPAGAEQSREGDRLSVTFTPGEELIGTTTLTFRADDGQQGHAPVEASCQLVVAAAPQPPVDQPPSLAVPARLAVLVGQQAVLRALAVDPEGEALTFTVEGAPPEATQTEDQPGRLTVSWLATAEQVGSTTVTIRVTDGQPDRQPVEAACEVVTEEPPPPVNLAPSLLVPPTAHVRVGSELALELLATDPEGDALTFTVPDLPDGATLEGDGGRRTLRWAPRAADVGERTLTVQVSDGQPERVPVQASCTITVEQELVPPNSPPLLLLPDRVDGWEGQELVVVAEAIDPEGDALSWTVEGAPEGAEQSVDDETGTLVVRWTPGFADSGELALTVTVTDAVGDHVPESAQCTVRIAEVDRPPAFVPEPPAELELAEGERREVELAAADPDAEDQVSLTPLALPRFAMLEQLGPGSVRLVLEPLSGEAGAHSVVLLAADDREPPASAQAVITVRVSPVSRAPQLFCAPREQTVVAGRPASVEIHAADPDGEVPAITVLQELPPYVTFAAGEPGRAELQIAAGLDDVGQAGQLTVQACDPGGLCTEREVSWEVVEAADDVVQFVEDFTSTDRLDLELTDAVIDLARGGLATVGVIDLPVGSGSDGVLELYEGELHLPAGTYDFARVVVGRNAFLRATGGVTLLVRDELQLDGMLEADEEGIAIHTGIAFRSSGEVYSFGPVTISAASPQGGIFLTPWPRGGWEVSRGGSIITWNGGWDVERDGPPVTLMTRGTFRSDGGYVRLEESQAGMGAITLLAYGDVVNRAPREDAGARFMQGSAYGDQPVEPVTIRTLRSIYNLDDSSIRGGGYGGGPVGGSITLQAGGDIVFWRDSYLQAGDGHLLGGDASLIAGGDIELFHGSSASAGSVGYVPAKMAGSPAPLGMDGATEPGEGEGEGEAPLRAGSLRLMARNVTLGQAGLLGGYGHDAPGGDVELLLQGDLVLHEQAYIYAGSADCGPGGALRVLAQGDLQIVQQSEYEPQYDARDGWGDGPLAAGHSWGCEDSVPGNAEVRLGGSLLAAESSARTLLVVGSPPRDSSPLKLAVPENYYLSFDLNEPVVLHALAASTPGETLSWHDDWSDEGVTREEEGGRYTLSWPAGWLGEGWYSVYISAEDSYGGWDERWIEFYVGPGVHPNKEPLLLAPYAVSAPAGEPLALAAVFFDLDGDELLPNVSGLPDGATVEVVGQQIIVHWTPGEADVGIGYELSFEVVEQRPGGSAVSASCSLTVGEPGEPADAPPSLYAPDWIEGEEGRPLVFAAAAVDPEGQPVMLQVEGLPEGAQTEQSPGLLVIRWTPDFGQSASYPLLFTASDGTPGNEVAVESWLEVYWMSDNAPPLLVAPIWQVAEVGQPLEVRALAADPEGEQMRLWVAGAPAEAQIVREGDDLVVRWTPGEADRGRAVSLTFLANDGDPPYEPVEPGSGYWSSGRVDFAEQLGDIDVPPTPSLLERAEVVSLPIDAGREEPRYGLLSVLADVPPGTSYRLTFSCADSPDGPFVGEFAEPSGCDGHRYLIYRLSLDARFFDAPRIDRIGFEIR